MSIEKVDQGIYRIRHEGNPQTGERGFDLYTGEGGLNDLIEACLEEFKCSDFYKNLLLKQKEECNDGINQTISEELKKDSGESRE